MSQQQTTQLIIQQKDRVKANNFFVNRKGSIEFIGLKNSKPENRKVEVINNNIISIYFEFDDHSVYTNSLVLFDNIEENVKITHLNCKTEIDFVCKLTEDQTVWPRLLKDKNIELYNTKNISTDFYGNMKKSYSEWNNVDKIIEKELADNEPTDDVNNFFKKLFGNADDDTKKAMMKSFIESGGTTLSTNWNEVKNKKISS